MKELDELLLHYLEQQYPAADAAEQRQFVELLKLQDPELYAYLSGRAQPADAAMSDVIRKITAADRA